jgi:Leucine-rich repeat (LRR) protein
MFLSPSHSVSRLLAFVALAVWGVLPLGYATAQSKGDAIQLRRPEDSFSATVRKAWVDAGFCFGWILEDVPVPALESTPPKSNRVLPAFQKSEWPVGVVARLPHPDEPFALNFAEAKVSDETLKEISKLGELSYLCIDAGQVTARGFLHLAALKKFRTLHIIGGKLAKEELKAVSHLTSLRSLALVETDVTVADLGSVRQLQRLSLLNGAIPPAGARALAGLEHLEELSLNVARLNDAAIKELANCRKLSRLDLGGNNLDKITLTPLRTIKPLKSLSLSRTHITDDFVKQLVAFENLEELVLDNNEVSDAGLAYVVSLTKLRELSICNTMITDDGLKHLRRLKSLRLLRAASTSITEAGIKALKEYLPNLRIDLTPKQRLEAAGKECRGPLPRCLCFPPNVTCWDKEGKEDVARSESLSSFRIAAPDQIAASWGRMQSR